MSQEQTDRKAKRSRKATTLKQGVVNYIRRLIKTRGLKVAMEELQKLNECFSREDDWPDIAREVDGIFEQEQARLQAAADARQQEMDAAFIEGLKKGYTPAQLNFMTGQGAQAPYLSGSNQPKREVIGYEQ